MSNEHSHQPDDIAVRLSYGQKPSLLRDAVYGAIDGAVTTFAIVAGVAGAGLPNSVIIALGCANIVADGFSMAAGNYSGIKAEMDDRQRLISIERRHIELHPSGEKEELRQILAIRGLSGTVLEQAVDAISRQKDKWIDFMLTDEYGLPREVPQPMRMAMTTFVSFLIAGSVPLLPFVLGLPNPFDVSVVATLVTFFLIGTVKSRWSLTAWWRSALETLLIGSIAAVVAFAVGSLFAT